MDDCFSEYNLAVEVGEKEHNDRDLIFQKKRKKALEKNLDCKFIRTNPSKESHDVFYEIVRIQTFISEFKNTKIKELEEEIKELKAKIIIKDGAKKEEKYQLKIHDLLFEL